MDLLAVKERTERQATRRNVSPWCSSATYSTLYLRWITTQNFLGKRCLAWRLLAAPCRRIILFRRITMMSGTAVSPLRLNLQMDLTIRNRSIPPGYYLLFNFLFDGIDICVRLCITKFFNNLSAIRVINVLSWFFSVVLNNDLNQIVQKFSEHYHDAWASRKLENGWTHGEQWSDANKTHPRLKPYNMLNDYERERYKEPVRESLKALLAIGWSVEHAEVDVPSTNRNSVRRSSKSQVRNYHATYSICKRKADAIT